MHWLIFKLFAYCEIIVMLFCRLLIFFFKNNFYKIFQEYHQSVKQFGSRSGFVGPDLGPNCLQRLSADDIGRES